MSVTLNPGQGGSVVKCELIGGEEFPVSKLRLGADGVDGGDVSSSNPMPVDCPGLATATTTSVAGAASSTQLLASNTLRRAASIFNDSSATLYVKFGTAASTTSFKVKLLMDDYFEFPYPCYTGVVHGIWASATGSARISEETI